MRVWRAQGDVTYTKEGSWRAPVAEIHGWANMQPQVQSAGKLQHSSLWCQGAGHVQGAKAC